MGDENTDLATILLKMGTDDGGEILSTTQIRSHLYTFMFAGFDTTATGIHWILFFLGQHPEMVKRIGIVVILIGKSHIRVTHLRLDMPDMQVE